MSSFLYALPIFASTGRPCSSVTMLVGIHVSVFFFKKNAWTKLYTKTCSPRIQSDDKPSLSHTHTHTLSLSFHPISFERNFLKHEFTLGKTEDTRGEGEKEQDDAMKLTLSTPTLGPKPPPSLPIRLTSTLTADNLGPGDARLNTRGRGRWSYRQPL